MQDRFDLREDNVFALHFAAGLRQPSDEDLRRAYGQRLKETAAMLLQEDWYTLTKDSETLQTVISSIKYVASNISDLRQELMSIVSSLYRAGERSIEADFSIRQIRFDEFSTCYEKLESAAELLQR